jgi:hypothetical protein
MSCHIGPPTTVGPTGATKTLAAGWAWAGFGVPNTGTAAAPAFVFGGVDHAGLDATTVCTTCHNGTMAPGTIAGFHNGLKTLRAGLIWDGADQSVEQGKRVVMTITGVSKSGTNLLVTWTATLDGAPVDPCNTTITDTAPGFHAVTANAATGQVAGGFSILKAYAQGDDWVNAGQTGTVSPGQPTSVNLSATNTACAANVATSTIAGDAYVPATVTKGQVSIQGKPQVRFAAAIATSPANEIIAVRAKSPTREFLVADGAAPAAGRRSIVDVDKCNACHKGSLYQHGGNRVDSTALCSMCHNPAANETNVRVGFGVTAAEAYDGKPGESYDLRNMVHAIHSAGESGRAIVIYRTRGIYFFGSQAALDEAIANRNWPTTGGITCQGAEGPQTSYKVYGSIASGTVPEANPDGTCKTTGLVASTDGTWQVHNVVLVHYPQPLNNCGACHSAGWTPATADGSKAVGVTVDAGAAPWGNQLDDVLQGPTATSCMSCHQSGDPTKQFYLRQHAYDGGWVPTTFEAGRQTLLDAVP